MSSNSMIESELTKLQIVQSLRKLGLKTGDVLLVHAAMRTLGHVLGGPDTVIEALLETIGSKGTLIVPTFTFKHEAEEDPIIDPDNDPSEVGIISETLRRRSDSLRSIAFRHSFAAVGRRASVITQVDPSLSPFDLRSSFGVMLALNTQVLLIGMAYSTSCTSHHFAEWVCEVPYRHMLPKNLRVRQPDGNVRRIPMIDYQPKPSNDGSYYGSRHADFNRLGRMLEDKNLVAKAPMGNAAVRKFAMRDLIDLAQIEAKKDYNVFRTPQGRPNFMTPLEFGNIILSPPLTDGAGRHNSYQWCVMNSEYLKKPKSK